MKRWMGFVCVAWLGMSGCGGGGANEPLPPDPSARTQLQTGSGIDQRRSTLNDRPGALMYDNGRSDPQQANSTVAPDSRQVTGVSPAVDKSVRTPRDEAVARAGLGTSASTLPAPAGSRVTQPGVGVGNSLTLGSVVVEVNGKPIFGNKLLKSVELVLAAKAKELDEKRFRVVATDEINKQLKALVQDELLYAMAERNLEPDDRRMATFLTERDRTEMIRRAGGSLELAKQAAAAQGYDFDELLNDKARVNLVKVYWQKVEYPRLQVTADDMRAYYQHHLNDIFTQRSQAQFRVIKIDFKRTGGREQALAKANDLHARAARGEDFANIAGSINDDPFLMRSKGDVTGTGGWMDRGAYANQKLEAAVWALNPGEVTNVIEVGDAFYIAKLEQKKTGRVLSFDEEEVQSAIRQTLEQEQLRAAKERALNKLMQTAIVTPDPPNIAPVVEMAMQKYPQWAAK